MTSKIKTLYCCDLIVNSLPLHIRKWLCPGYSTELDFNSHWILKLRTSLRSVSNTFDSLEFKAIRYETGIYLPKCPRWGYVKRFNYPVLVGNSISKQ